MRRYQAGGEAAEPPTIEAMADDRPRLGGRPSLDGEALVVLGLVWGDDGCRVRLRVPDPGPDGTIEPSQLVPVVGLELNYRVGPDARRHCLGHSSPQRNNGAYVDCHNRPQPNEKTCVSCAVADAEFASNLHHAHTRQRDALDRSVVDHLEQTNELYVAAFRDGSLKIGTSTGHRTAKRLTEQGAWRAVRVASVTDGFTVRLLEDLVTEKLGLTQSVAVKRKLQGMTNPLGDRLLDERLDPMVQEVHRLIGSLDRLPGSAEPDGPEAQPDVGGTRPPRASKTRRGHRRPARGHRRPARGHRRPARGHRRQGGAHRRVVGVSRIGLAGLGSAASLPGPTRYRDPSCRDPGHVRSDGGAASAGRGWQRSDRRQVRRRSGPALRCRTRHRPLPAGSFGGAGLAVLIHRTPALWAAADRPL